MTSGHLLRSYKEDNSSETFIPGAPQGKVYGMDDKNDGKLIGVIIVVLGKCRILVLLKYPNEIIQGSLGQRFSTQTAPQPILFLI